MELVTHKWFASSLLLPQSCRGNHHKPNFFPPPFSRYQITPCHNPSCFSFLSSLASQAWWAKRDWSLTLPIHFLLASLCSNRPSSAWWSTFPSECSQAIHLFFPVFFPLFLSLLYLTLSLALPPQCKGFVLPCTFRLCVGWCCGLASGSLW